MRPIRFPISVIGKTDTSKADTVAIIEATPAEVARDALAGFISAASMPNARGHMKLLPELDNLCGKVEDFRAKHEQQMTLAQPLIQYLQK